jgi:ribulose-5-phosphate 4-epimerase/fuculose-1-phosphate aldolase
MLHRLGAIGVDPARYGGAGFGNASQRTPPYPGDRGRRAFVVTATQTGALAELTAEHWVHVTAYDADANRVTSKGALLPSSETLTHGAIYDLNPAIRAVLHVHVPALWQGAQRLRLPCTERGVDYGTPEMAREMARLWRTGTLADRRIVAMLGHEDGVIAFGRTADEAGATLATALAAAFGG